MEGFMSMGSEVLANCANIFKLTRAKEAGSIMVLPATVRRRLTSRTVVTPDYTNQLDLFSDAPQDAPASVLSLPVQPAYHHVRTRPPQQLDFGALEPLPAEDGIRTPAAKPVADSSADDGGPVQRPAL